MASKRLITFEGWDGQWWRRINVAKGVWDAANFVMPLKWSLAIWGLEELGKVVAKRVSRRRTRQRRKRRT